MSTQTEALKLALEQTLEMLNDNREYIEANERAEYLAMYDKAIAGAEKALAEQPAQQEIDIAALVEGMEVSVDVSTGDHNSGRRLFGSVTLAQENQGSKHGLILLVQNPVANFKHHPQAQPARGPLTEDEMWELHAKYPALPAYTRAIEAKLKG